MQCDFTDLKRHLITTKSYEDDGENQATQPQKRCATVQYSTYI